MLHEILEDDHIQWHPTLIRHNINLWPCYRTGPYYRIWILIAICFHKSFANGCSMPTEDAYPHGHLVLSKLAFAYVLIVETNDTLSHTLHQPLTYSQTWHVTNFYFITQYRFPKSICNVSGMPTGDAYSPDTWSCPTLGLAYVLMFGSISPKHVLFPDFEFRTSFGTSVLCPPWFYITRAIVTVYQLFCFFFHTCPLCRQELVAKFPMRGLTQVRLLCARLCSLWLWHFP